MPCMIWIAALVEAIINNWPDMAILLFIQFANASLSFYEVTKAGNAVKALKKSLKPEATVSTRTCTHVTLASPVRTHDALTSNCLQLSSFFL
jgi:magnesium-transporting ATPase (P-type)